MFPVDEAGLPGAIGMDGEFDGGDTAAIMGTILATAPLSGWLHFKMHSYLPVVLGRKAPRRHPDSSKWYGHEDRFSRDQLIPILCAAVRMRREWGAKIWSAEVIFDWHKQKLFLTAWNTRKNGVIDAPLKAPDITGPEIWALWIRYKRPWWSRLVLWVLDLETLIGSIVWRLKPYSDQITRNHMLVCITARKYSPTITSRMAYWMNDWPDLLSRWRRHCRATDEFDTSDMIRDALN